MWILGFILLECAVFCLLVWAFVIWDDKLADWEARMMKRVKRIARAIVRKLRRQLNRIGKEILWKTRKLRREICARILAKDGVSVQPLPATDRELDEMFTEVMRLLEK